MSATGRDAGGLNAGTSGSSSMGDRGLGSAEVHTGLHSGSGDQYSGLQFAGHESQSAGGRLRGAAETVRERVTGPARTLGARASEATSGVRDRLGGVRERANTALESRGILDRLRDNPLPVLGVAFALGFVLAGSDEDDDEGRPTTRASRARRELRNALMAGVSAGVAQGARGFLNQAGSQGGGFINGLLENLLGGTGEGSSELGSPSRSGGTGGSSYGGSTAGSRGGSSYGGSTGRSGSYAGGGSTGRPPSHQEY
ncbi:MAG TPA: hypothetical protein VF142_00520 [Longimicrobium sp.]